ncbi:contact-dependent growth inhibition system immunity protein [Pseudomonas fluorescens]|uniref:contact-dependent growth inhibition system immunity protein n=1 Tax=Pseudomonas fluorescens TaxID=294 RepID=UPI003526446B
MNQEYPELHEFFGAYFHQDWTVEHDTAEQVIEYFSSHSDPADLTLVLQELGSLLKLRKSEMELRSYLLRELSCYYCYWNEWESGEVWLRHIASKLGHKF